PTVEERGGISIGEGSSARLRGQHDLQFVNVQRQDKMLITQRKDHLVVAEPRVQQKIIRDLAGPQCLQNVRRLDLKPTCFLAHELIRGVAPEKTVLLVV